MARNVPSPTRLALAQAFYLAMAGTIAAILTMAAFLQYSAGETPCPLCLLQRVGMFGVAFAVMLNFRHGFSDRNSGIALIFASFLLVVATRQTLLDIYPRPGHSYVGTAIMGLHMPVWSILIALGVIVAFAVKLAVLGTEDGRPAPKSSTFAGRVATLIGFYLLFLAVVNFGSVVIQCGLDQCHTEGYRLLGWKPPTGS